MKKRRKKKILTQKQINKGLNISDPPTDTTRAFYFQTLIYRSFLFIQNVIIYRDIYM